MTETDAGIELSAKLDWDNVGRLTYFSSVKDGDCLVPTVQARLEDTAKSANGRQATRYSVHGLHEYKGKFNPQIAKSILNILQFTRGHRIVDPFCGSGTTLVECTHLGIDAVGLDLNPFAVFLANAKLLALSAPGVALMSALERIQGIVEGRRCWRGEIPIGSRGRYLRSWFEPHVLSTIEILRSIIRAEAGDYASIFLSILSDLLRDYSRQDPADLRVRRRTTVIPSVPLPDAFVRSANVILGRVLAAREILPQRDCSGEAILCDVGALSSRFCQGSFDGGITSPPYAMALPYVDTQRLSLVWLGLLPPERLMKLEADLVGGRETRGRARKTLLESMLDNCDGLPDQESAFCRMLHRAIGFDDGFRRRAVPILLYRYFTAMRDSFREALRVMRPDAPYALIVGHNHTVLGGTRFDIDTPLHLSSLARSAGWTIEEAIPLQTYRRYGYHANNAVTAEALLLLRAR